MRDAYVLGDGLPALAAALELAEVGLAVRVARVGEAFRELDESGERDPEGAIVALLEHLAGPIAAGGATTPGVRPKSLPPRPVLVRTRDGDWASLPEPSVCGIPAVPMAAESVAILGTRASARAALDRLKPVLTIGKTHSLGALVRSRLGSAVLERMVDPVVRERYGVGPEDVDAAVAAAGLNETLTRVGSLSGAVLAYAERSAEQETRVAPEAGWQAVRVALIERLVAYGVEFADTAPSAIREASEGWEVEEADGDRIGVRAVIEETGTGVASARVPGRLPMSGVARRLRSWLSVAIAEPAGIGTAAAAVCVVTAVPGREDRWSVRAERVGAEWRAVAQGPVRDAPYAVDAAGDGPDRGPDDTDRDDATAAILSAGFVPLGDGEAGALSDSGREAAVPPARDARRVAPFATVEQRDRAATELRRRREEEPFRLPIGAGLHGGDLSAALADTRSEAVALRRRLTGISD